MYTISKTFKGYPFAHRQPTHDGHCALIHGHNWDFEIFLEADELDQNGFVYDFGKFGWLKIWLAEIFDHTLVLNEDDPKLNYLINQLENQEIQFADIRIVPSCSSEGLAKFIFEKVENHLITIEGNSRVRVTAVKVVEDYKNWAIYQPN